MSRERESPPDASPNAEADNADDADAAAAVADATAPTASNAGGVERNLEYEQARLAYQIIQALLEHTRVTSDLVALMAQVIDEDTTRALTQTPYWNAYLDSRRIMERTRADIEKFAEMWTKLAAAHDDVES